MSQSPLAQVALAFATLSMFSVGGATAIIPALHRQAVDVFGWMNDAGFSSAVAISQAAPGPNMMIFSMVGWRVAGFSGLLAATVAALGPPSLLAFGVGRLFVRLSKESWFPRVSAGLAPVVAGLYLASGLVTARAADPKFGLVAITLAAAGLVATTRRNPLWALAGGAAVATGAAVLGFI